MSETRTSCVVCFLRPEKLKVAVLALVAHVRAEYGIETSRAFNENKATLFFLHGEELQRESGVPTAQYQHCVEDSFDNCNFDEAVKQLITL